MTVNLTITRTLGAALHVYADGNWSKSLAQWTGALRASGLDDALDSLLVGIVGTDENREKVHRWVTRNDAKVIAEATSGYEQVTQLAWLDYLHEADFWMYSHSKGAANDHTLNDRWRPYLIRHSITNWRQCAQEMADGADVVAANWMTEGPDGQQAPPDTQGFAPGTFWWATREHIQALPRPRDLHPHGAEVWVGRRPGDFTVVTTDKRPWNPANW